MSAIDTALGATLEYRADGWHWRDGTPEPRVRTMTLRDLAPNFRCETYASGCVVEIPHDWRDARHWPRGRKDPHAVSMIADVIRESGAPIGAIYADGLAERLDNNRLRTRGWTVPVELWDAALVEACGVWWDKTDEPDILTRARALGWEG